MRKENQRYLTEEQKRIDNLLGGGVLSRQAENSAATKMNFDQLANNVMRRDLQTDLEKVRRFADMSEAFQMLREQELEDNPWFTFTIYYVVITVLNLILERVYGKEE